MPGARTKDEKAIALYKVKLKYGHVGVNLYKLRLKMKQRIRALEQLPQSPETDALLCRYRVRVAIPINDYFLTRRSTRLKRSTARKAAKRIEETAKWEAEDPDTPLVPIEDPRNAGLNRAYQKHRACLRTHVKKNGKKGAHIGAGTQAAYERHF